METGLGYDLLISDTKSLKYFCNLTSISSANRSSFSIPLGIVIPTSLLSENSMGPTVLLISVKEGFFSYIVHPSKIKKEIKKRILKLKLKLNITNVLNKIHQSSNQRVLIENDNCLPAFRKMLCFKIWKTKSDGEF